MSFIDPRVLLVRKDNLMEKEQESSPFYLTPEVKIISSSDLYLSRSTRSLYKPLGEAREKFWTIFAKLYQWIDSLTNLESYKIPSQDFVSEEFATIFQLLRSAGIASGINFSRMRYNDAPSFTRCDISPAFPDEETKHTYTNSMGNGFGKDVSMSFSKAIGEFLERYFLFLYNHENLRQGSYNSLRKEGIHCVDPTSIMAFTEEQKKQYPRRNVSADNVFFWEKATRFTRGEEILVPAQLIYWHYDYAKNEGEPVLSESNTNGAGGYFTQEGAILSGLYELVQRDAFLIYWLNKVAPPKIIPETVPSEGFQKILKESKRFGFDIHCLNTTLDTGIPSFAVVIIDPSGVGPYFSVGGGCQADATEALHRTLEEAWSVYYAMRPRNFSTYTLPESYKPFGNHEVGRSERLLLAANPVMAKHYQFFLEGKSHDFNDVKFEYPKKFLSTSEELRYTVKEVEKLGPEYEVIYHAPKNRILEQLGYYTVKVIVTGFTQLYLQETLAPLASRRLREVPPKFGFKATIDPNPWPHPFP